MTEGLDDKKLVGVCFAMMLSKGDAFEALPHFVKNIPKDRLKKIRFELQHYLNKIHSNHDVSRWLHDNYDVLDRDIIPVINHANETLDSQAHNMLTMACLC